MVSGPVEVFAGDPSQARRAWSALEGHGIRASLVDDSVATLGAFHGAGIVARVVVAAPDADAARDVLIAQGLVAPGGLA